MNNTLDLTKQYFCFAYIIHGKPAEIRNIPKEVAKLDSAQLNEALGLIADNNYIYATAINAGIDGYIYPTDKDIYDGTELPTDKSRTLCHSVAHNLAKTIVFKGQENFDSPYANKLHHCKPLMNYIVAILEEKENVSWSSFVNKIRTLSGGYIELLVRIERFPYSFKKLVDFGDTPRIEYVGIKSELLNLHDALTLALVSDYNDLPSHLMKYRPQLAKVGLVEKSALISGIFMQQIQYCLPNDPLPVFQLILSELAFTKKLKVSNLKAFFSYCSERYSIFKSVNDAGFEALAEFFCELAYMIKEVE